MPEFLVEYIVTQHRFSRVQAHTDAEARQLIKEYHEQQVSEKITESVMIVYCSEDK
jgi:hypothetical protein